MLNILPSTKKAQIKKEQLYSKIKAGTILIIIFFIFADAIMITSRLLLAQWMQNLESSVTEVIIADDERIEIEQNLDALTKSVSSINKIQSNYKEPVDPVVVILDAIPENTAIQSLTIFFDTNSVVGIGTTYDRDSMFTLQDHLNSVSSLNNVSFKVLNFSLKQNIPFEFSANIDYEKIID